MIKEINVLFSSSSFQMNDFIQRLDTLLNDDPFGDLDRNLLSANDCEVGFLFRFCFLKRRSSSYWKNTVENISMNENEYVKSEKLKR